MSEKARVYTGINALTVALVDHPSLMTLDVAYNYEGGLSPLVHEHDKRGTRYAQCSNPPQPPSFPLTIVRTHIHQFTVKQTL